MASQDVRLRITIEVCGDAVDSLSTIPVGRKPGIPRPATGTFTLYDQLRRDEGDEPNVYKDQFGNLTIGVGHNLSAKGLSERARQVQLEDDVAAAVADIHNALPWTRSMQEVRFRVLVNMVFNMGIGNAATGTGLLGFKRMLAAIQAQDWNTAAAELLNSNLAQQTGARAQRLAKQLITNQMQ